MDGKTIVETKSEKLLGVVINNELTWKEHLYGEGWREESQNAPGLIPQLSQRVRILRRLSKFVNTSRLKLFAEGMFYSKLSYCLPVFGNVFGLDGHKDTTTRYSSFTKKDNRRLQVLQNSIMILLTGSPRGTPTTTLLKNTSSLSVQQLVASQTLVMEHKVIHTARPAYLAARLKVKKEEDGRRVQAKSQGMLDAPNLKLTISKEDFIARGVKLFNILPPHIRTEPILPNFRSMMRKWIIENIPARPT